MSNTQNLPQKADTRSYLTYNLDRKQADLISLLGTDKKAEQFKANVLSLLGNSEIEKCDKISLFVSAFKIAQLQLSPIQELGQAYIVPRNNKKKGIVEATLQIGYKGWQVLAQRAGIHVKAKVVYNCDIFQEHATESGISIKYAPNYEEHPDKLSNIMQDLKGVLVFSTVGKNISYDFVPAKVIKKRFEMSKRAMFGKESPAWVEFTEEMILAKALKYILTKMPLDVMAAGIETITDAVTAEVQQDVAQLEEVQANSIEEIAQPLDENNEPEPEPLPEPQQAEIVNEKTGEVIEVEPLEPAKPRQAKFVDDDYDDDEFYKNNDEK